MWQLSCEYFGSPCNSFIPLTASQSSLYHPVLVHQANKWLWKLRPWFVSSHIELKKSGVGGALFRAMTELVSMQYCWEVIFTVTTQQILTKFSIA
jgi:hypothetical protein